MALLTTTTLQVKMASMPSVSINESPNIKDLKLNSITDDYKVEWKQKLGTGVSGPVRPCIKKSTGERFALKCLLDSKRARREVELQKILSSNPNIVAIYDVYSNEVQFPTESKPRDRLFVVMEMMDGGEFFDRISKKKSFTEKEASKYTRQIAAAIEACHSLNIAHRDIKPENLLMNDNTEDAIIKLSDFGFAKVDDGNLMTPHFTPYYVAPQVLKAKERQKERNVIQMRPPVTYDKSCDMWSLGVVIYIMLCGYPPFYSETPSKTITERMKKKIMAGEYSFPSEDWNHISKEGVDMVKGLLTVDQEDRLTIGEVLTHPWLQKAPETILQSPCILMDQDAFAMAMEAHSEQLTAMRLPDRPIKLKDIKNIKSPLHKKREGNNRSMQNSTLRDGAGEPSHKHSTSSVSTQSLRDVIAHCIYPPKESADNEAILNNLVLRACQCNSDNKNLQSLLETWRWNGNRFECTVDKQKLAFLLKQLVEESSEKT